MKYENQRNPILPVEFHVPDGEAHVMPDGKLYVYGSYDALDITYCSQEYRVISTPDMKQWTVHDVSFRAQDVPWMGEEMKYPGLDWQNPTPFLQKMIDSRTEEPAEVSQEEYAEWRKQELLFAPDAVCHNGKYYLYFCMSGGSEGVAVSDKPEGPFRAPVQLPCGQIDPAVFIDDDGQAYYYWGQTSGKGVKLNEDMMSFDADQVVDNLVTEKEHYFHEGSSVRKIGDTYYYIFADMERGKPTSLGYATSKSPLGPFVYQGIIIDNDGCDPQSWNNHGSIECVNGQWYVFYHRCSRNTQMYRRLCMEKIYVNDDGTIDEVKMTSQGAGAPFLPGEKIMGYQACGMKGNCFIDVENRFGYGEKLTNISAGDEAIFRYLKNDKSWTGICLAFAGSGKVTVLLNGKEALTVSLQGERDKEYVVNAAFDMESGEYELVLRFDESDGLELFSVTLL
ncbi:MAG: family 43 glycosylhydrolase [Eubacterium sp.]|nr:family 43 glycosylhydrolase [Eubacterium sp.]